MSNTITISKQKLREIILDVIDEGNGTLDRDWELYKGGEWLVSEERANSQRLDFCDAIQSKLDKENK